MNGESKAGGGGLRAKETLEPRGSARGCCIVQNFGFVIVIVNIIVSKNMTLGASLSDRGKRWALRE